MEALTRRGPRLARFTVGYNVVEGTVAVTAGVLAGLVSVVGSGIDSGIESVAGVLVALRLAARLRDGRASSTTTPGTTERARQGSVGRGTGVGAGDRDARSDGTAGAAPVRRAAVRT